MKHPLILEFRDLDKSLLVLSSLQILFNHF